MIAATPRLAATAISRMTCTSMREMVIEPDRVRGEGHRPGQQQPAKARARRVEAARAADRFRADRVHHLHAVADPDREHEERHQDGHRVDAEPEDGQPAELPDDGDEGSRRAAAR